MSASEKKEFGMIPGIRDDFCFKELQQALTCLNSELRADSRVWKPPGIGHSPGLRLLCTRARSSAPGFLHNFSTPRPARCCWRWLEASPSSCLTLLPRLALQRNVICYNALLRGPGRLNIQHSVVEKDFKKKNQFSNYFFNLL